MEGKLDCDSMILKLDRWTAHEESSDNIGKHSLQVLLMF